jgi:DNA-binding transcriptional ArsR family regulator
MTVDTLSRVFAALADPTRRDMVARLAEGDATVSELAEPYRMTLQAVYKHLRVLEDAGLVSRPRGPQPRPVRLQVQVFDLMDAWIERHRVRAEQRYRRLDAVLAQMKGEKHDTGSPKRSSDPAEDHRGGHRGRSGPAGHPDDS